MKQKIEVDVNHVVTHLKNTMLGLSKDIACHHCDKPYCCRSQRRIEISTTEFKQIKPYITEEQKERARQEIKHPRTIDGMSVYTCPFNDPANGKCQIYDYRFVVCASHGVVEVHESICDTESARNGTHIINPMQTMQKAMQDDQTMTYLRHVSEGEPTDILEAFKDIV